MSIEKRNLNMENDEAKDDDIVGCALNYLETYKDFQDLFEEVPNDRILKIVNKVVCERTGDTLLHMAVQYDAVRAVEELLTLQADQNLKNKFGSKPLHQARKKKIVRLLHKHGADLNEKDSSGFSLLIIAIVEENVDLVCYLLNKKVNSEDAKTFLGLPANCKDEEILKEVIKTAYYE